MRRLFMLLIFLAALMAAGNMAWAQALMPGALQPVDLNPGEQSFSFSPNSGSIYDICLFPAGEEQGDCHAALYDENDRLLAEGAGDLTALSMRLTAQAAYTLRLKGEGQFYLEIARHALSRCFDVPVALQPDGDTYSKAIARSGDVHWYAITAETNKPVALSGLPLEPEIQLEARLFDETGHLLSEATRTAGGAFLMDYLPQAGVVYRVRVSSQNGATGLYTLSTEQIEGGMPQALHLSEGSIQLEGVQSHRLLASIQPEDASQALLWESSDTEVAIVDQRGNVTGQRPGIAVISVYGAGAISARCRVEVSYVPVEEIRLRTPSLTLAVGDEVALRWQILPQNATEQGVQFDVEPEQDILAVDDRGVLRGLKPGTATVTLSTLDGDIPVTAQVRVDLPPRRSRALLIGEQNYASTVALPRQGSVNSVQGLRSMLRGLNVNGSPCEVTTALDVSRDGVLSVIAETFAPSVDQDFNLIYITCHGFYDFGMTCFQLYDGSILTAMELRDALQGIPGEILLMVDCCESGGIIGSASTPEEILEGIESVYSGYPGSSLFDTSRFTVLASASAGEDSYRIGFDGKSGESTMATVFARALCDALGWNLEKSAQAELLADQNGDKKVSLNELYLYISRRVRWYLSLDSNRHVQTVRLSPQGDTRGIFER